MDTKLPYLVAKINLHHMASLAFSMFRTVEYAAKNAQHDENFIETPLQNSFPKASKEDLAMLAGMYAGITIEDSFNSVHAAGLIFAHTGLEKCIEVISEFDSQEKPLDWINLIENKKVAISQIIQHTKDELIELYLKDYLESLKKESLTKKIDILLSILKPVSGTTEKYKFDKARINKIDNNRHKYAHGKIGNIDLLQTKEEIEYLIDTGEFFLSLISKRYDIDD